MKTRDGARIELREICRTAGDIASDEVRVHPLEIRREHDTALVDAVSKPRCKPLDLRLHSLAHVDGRAVRHVAVRPQRVLSVRSTRRIESARLHYEHVGPLGNTTTPWTSL